MHEQNIPTKPPEKKFPLWFMAYVFLALFNIVTVVGSVYLSHTIVEIYKKTVETDAIWSAKQDALVDILSKVLALNVPGNDIFQSKDAKQERGRFDAALSALNASITLFESRMRAEIPAEQQTDIARELQVVRAGIDKMVGAGRSVFAFFENGQEEAAAAHMAAMDNYSKDTAQHVILALDAVDTQQARILQADIKQLENLRRIEAVFGALILLMIMATAVYGLRMLNQRRTLEESQEKLLLSAEEDRAKLSAILDTAGDAIITIDTKGEILSFNTAAEWIFGYAEAEIRGQNVSVLMPQPHRDRHDAYIGKYLDTGKGEIINTSREEYALHKSGRTFPIELSVTEIKLAGGSRLFTAFIRDITDRKKSELSIQKYTDELEQQARALEIAKGQAERATRMKSEFLANMSHEIRTPMNGIIGMASLLSDTQLGSRQRHFLDTIKSSADGLLQIINDILDFSKIEAGRIELDPIPIDMRALVADVVSLLASAPAEGDVKILYTYAPDAPRYVVGDPVRIRQVFVNLIGNARKFTKSGSVTTEIEGEKLSDGRIRFMAKVIDTGIGIPADKLEYIFDKFSQADASTTRKFGGTGLGLAICRKIVEMMDGKIFATSVMGQGSTFHFSIILDECRDANDIAALKGEAEKAGTRPQSKPHYQGVSVLLVEDNLVNQEVASTMLNDYGCTVDTAENGLIAVGKATKNTYDLIFMDLQMPELDGLEATAKIRQAGIITPIVAFTANAMKGDDEKCLAAGMNDYMSKPVQVAVLEAKLRQWLPAEKMVAYSSLPQVAAPEKTINESLNAIDMGTYAKLKDMMGDRFSILLEKFVHTSTGYIADARSAFLDGDAGKLASCVHPLKSSSASLGFVGLANIARDLEVAARDLEKLSEPVLTLAQQITDLEAAHKHVMAFIASRKSNH
ncbi:MAG: PAS domain S-box protein [Proteobacteria bacterium]|nr:PAS domain S-box protein [Pseudomonadota bacterium]